MAMHQGMDLSRFKKISGDKNSSVLRHSKGHEIKIAHSGLTPKMMEHLKNMPVHMAEAGEVPPLPEQDVSEPEQIIPQDTAPAPPPAPEQGGFSVVPNGSFSAPTNVPQETQPWSAAPQAVAPDAPDPDLTPQGKIQEQIAHANDVASGQIHPKTYHDLFAEKSTLGKIGTIFGLLLSGAGSGLAHQPNMLMDMMNKQLDKDLEAQKQNKDNARNFLSVKNAQNVQEADAAAHRVRSIGQGLENTRNAMQNALYFEGSGITGYKDYPDYYNRVMAYASGPFEAKAAMIPVVVHDLKVKSGPNQAAQNMIKTVVEPQSNAMIAKLHADGAKAGLDAAKASPRRPPIDDKLFNHAVDRGVLYKDAPFRAHDIITKDEKEATTPERAKLAKLHDSVYNYHETFQKIAAMKKAGQAPFSSMLGTAAGALAGGVAMIPGVGPALAATLGAVGSGAGHTVGNFAKNYTERDRDVAIGDFIANLPGDLTTEQRKELVKVAFPSWQEENDPEKLAEIERKGMQYFKNIETGLTPNLDILDARFNHKLKAPFPELHYEAPKKEEEKKDSSKSSGWSAKQKHRVPGDW